MNQTFIKVVTDVADDSIAKAARDVISKTKNDECGVSVDRMQQYRRFISLNCCVAALLVNTGKV